MLKRINKKVTIICDKCGHSQTASEEKYNEAFFTRGWSLNMSAKKYKHTCNKCHPRKIY